MEIVGANYSGSWNRCRITCRGIVLDGDQILLTHAKNMDLWMIPGGGVEGDESDRECCIREISEETGLFVEPSECVAEIVEYYENSRLINKYFVCEVVGTTSMKQTENEKQGGMEPRWVSVDECLDIFSKYASYDGVDETKRGLYLREYSALKMAWE